MTETKQKKLHQSQNVSPLTVVTVLLALAMFIAGNFYLKDLALTVDRLSLTSLHPDGVAVVKMGNQLYKLTSAGAESLVALDQLGIDSTLGGFAFFSDGSLLVQANDYQPALGESLAIRARADNEHYGNDGRNRLLRCHLMSKKCRAFAPLLPDVNRTFRLFIDHQTDTVYLADTSRHRIIKLDSEGNQLAIKSGLKFPNQLKLINDQLWVADTNHQRIIQVDAHTETFGDELAAHIAPLDLNRRWPADIARVGEQWWVLVMDKDMKNGKIMRFDDDWQKIRSLPLPGAADPMAIQLAGDSVLVPDYSRFVIYHFDLRGERLADPAIGTLASKLEDARNTYRVYSALSLGLWAVLFSAVLLGLLYGLHTIPEQFEPRQVNAAQPAHQIPETGMWLQPHWLLRGFFYLYLATVLVAIPISTWLVVVALLASGSIPGVSFLLIFAGIIALLIAMLYPLCRQIRCKLGLYADHVVFVDHSGLQYQYSYDTIPWSETAFKLGDRVIPLPINFKIGLFPAKKIRTYLMPRLNGEKYVNKWLMLRYQFYSPDRSLQVAVAIIVFFGLVKLGIELGRIFV